MNDFLPQIPLATSLHELLSTMNGPDFLKFYACWFVFTLVVLMILRRIGLDTWLMNFIFLFLYEGLGFARYQIASAAGMHRFEILIIMMACGVPFFIFRVQKEGENRSGAGLWITQSRGNGGCGSSGCGGSGCGGGGCGGGCGGCGGG